MRAYSEAELKALAHELALTLRPGDRVLLKGELGAGKSTFVRAALEALEAPQGAGGSPTYPIVHQYETARGSVFHMDCYRLVSEAEFEVRGLNDLLWDQNYIGFVEWLDRFEAIDESLELRPPQGGRVFRVRIESVEGQPDRRSVSCNSLF